MGESLNAAISQLTILQALRVHLEYVYGGYVNEEINPLDMFDVAVAD